MKRRVRTRVRPDGSTVSVTTFQAVWREHPQAPDRTKTFKRRAEAERHLVDVQHRLLTGAYASPGLGRTPFRVAADRYLGLGVWRPRTRQSATEKPRYAVDHFGDRQIVTIRKGDVQAFLAGLSKSLAPNTVRIVRQHLAATFSQAIDDRLITINPCQGVRLAKVERQVVLPLSHADVVALYDAAAPWFRVAIVIGAGLGLRQSEAAGLTMDRVDFLRRTVRVDRQWQQTTASKPGAFTPTKTAAGTRIIPVGEWVLDELNLHLEEFGAGDGGVIVHTDGRPADAARWGHYMRAARKHAGVSDQVSFHDLRHFYASALIAAGCTVKQVQAALGHESAKVTLDVYGHLWPGDEDRVRDAIDRLGAGSTKDLKDHGLTAGAKAQVRGPLWAQAQVPLQRLAAVCRLGD